ncbi:MAG: hypothetical protein ACREXS_17535, partial [Gammaproteobacteria bacterium]
MTHTPSIVELYYKGRRITSHKRLYPNFLVRRAKARSFSGCERRPATFAPAGSNRSSRDTDAAAEAF